MGALPDVFAGQTALQTLLLAGNQLTSRGTIPASLKALRATAQLTNWSLTGNPALADCGLADTNAADCGALLAAATKAWPALSAVG